MSGGRGPARKQRESGVLSQVQRTLKDLKKQGHPIHWRKTHGNSFVSGEPDLDICAGGRTIKLELKRPGGVPTMRQMATLRLWKAAGAVATWADSAETVREIVLDVLGVK